MLIYNDQKGTINEQNEELYTMFIPEDNFWRRLNQEVDFTFIYTLVKNTHSTILEPEIDPIKMFKKLLLKTYYNLSDEDLIDKTNNDMTFKFFLEHNPLEINQITVENFNSFRHYVIKEDNDTIESLFKKAMHEDRLFQRINQFNFYSYLQTELAGQLKKAKTYIKRMDKDLYAKVFLENDKMKAAQLLIDFKKFSNLSLSRDLKMRINYLQELIYEMKRVIGYGDNQGIEKYNLTMQELAIVFLNNLKYKIKHDNIF